MRTTALLGLLGLAQVTTSTLDPFMIEAITAVIPTEVLAAGVATLFTSTVINHDYGRKNLLNPLTLLRNPGAGLPLREDLPPRFAKEIPGSKTVKIRYGPYMIPNMYKLNGFLEGGSLWNYPDPWVSKPCDDKCVIFGMNAGLEYMDGKNANVDTDAWLHHMVLFNIGLGRVDQTCAGATIEALPHANVGCTPWLCERIFASGNERTPAFFADAASLRNGSRPVGYHVRSTDRFAVIIDLMNDSAQDKTVYLTMYYDYMEGWPSNFDHMRPVWLDVDECGISDVRPYSQSGKFTVKAKPWSATMDGEVLGYGGHLHDGGTRIHIYVDGQEDCPSDAIYGAAPEFIAPMAEGGAMGKMNSKSATVHISNMTLCNTKTTLRTTRLKKGQKWVLTADYDYDKHLGKLDEAGWQEPVTGIVIMYVRQPWNESNSRLKIRGTSPIWYRGDPRAS